MTLEFDSSPTRGRDLSCNKAACRRFDSDQDGFFTPYSPTIRMRYDGSASSRREELFWHCPSSAVLFAQFSSISMETILTKFFFFSDQVASTDPFCKPLFEPRAHRTVYAVGDKSHAIALTMDLGKIATARSLPLCEIELEHPAGRSVHRNGPSGSR